MIKRKTIATVLYIFRLVLLILSFVIFLFLFPSIIKAKGAGIFLIITFFLLIITTVFSLFMHKQIFKEQLSYNVVYIGSLIYLILIWAKIFFDKRLQLTVIYELNIDYIQNNCIIMGIVFLGIVFNTFLLGMNKEITFCEK